MGVIFIASPDITPLSYTLFAPWMHSSVNHISQNLLIFILLGTWVEKRLGKITFLLFALLVPYLALYLPVVLEYGSLSRGASGLTNALIGYVIPVLLIGLSRRIRCFGGSTRELATGLGVLLSLVYLISSSGLTIQRFIGLEPRPDGIAVSAHMTGLVLGILWFCWRTLRHRLEAA